jgi:hypothetical protein
VLAVEGKLHVLYKGALNSATLGGERFLHPVHNWERQLAVWVVPPTLSSTLNCMIEVCVFASLKQSAERVESNHCGKIEHVSREIKASSRHRGACQFRSLSLFNQSHVPSHHVPNSFKTKQAMKCWEIFVSMLSSSALCLLASSAPPA